MGWFRPVHAKTFPAQEIRALLTARKLLQGKLHGVELGLRGMLRGFELKLGQVGKARHEARVRELVAGQPTLEPLAEAKLRAADSPDGGVCQPTPETPSLATHSPSRPHALFAVASGFAIVPLSRPERRFSRSRPPSPRMVGTWLWRGSRSSIAVATTGSPNTAPTR